jgi:hypothetical protein
MKKLRLGQALALAALLLAGGLVRADDTKKKKEKDKEFQESSIESTEARGVMDRVVKKLKDEAWQDAFAAARELVDKHGDTLLLVDETIPKDEKSQSEDQRRLVGLHRTAGAVLRRKLATMPAEGRAALKVAFAEDAQQRLASGKAAGDVAALVECGDRYFPLVEGAEALLAVGDLELERGCLVASALAWRDVLDLHPEAAERAKAAQRLVALVPLLADPSTAKDLEATLRREADGEQPFDGAQDLAVAARRLAKQLEDAEAPDCSVDACGGFAAIYSAAPFTSATAVAKKIVLKSDDVKGIDWRSEEKVQNQWGQQVPPMRRLLSGHMATDELLLVHLGKAIFAYWTDDDAESGIKEGDPAWVVGHERGIASYLRDVQSSAALARFGIAIETDQDRHDRRRARDPEDPREKELCAYATLADRSIDETGLLPRGHLVCFDVRTGGSMDEKDPYWDTKKKQEPDDSEDLDRQKRKKKKKDDEKGAAEDKAPVRLSYIGTPVVGGRRIFSPAANALEPNETYVAAVDARDGRLLWKRSLAVSSPFNDAANPWGPVFPRVMPTPSISLAGGAVIALSNNGALVALDPIDGRVLWARVYDRDEDAGGNRQPWRQNPEEIASVLNRGYNPPLALGDLVLTLPTDSKSMSLIRLSDGEQVTKPHPREKYDHILGVRSGRVVLAGAESVGFYRVEREEKRSRVSLSVDTPVSLTGKNKPKGRGILNGDTVYLPCDKGIIRIRDGKSRSAMDWDEAQKKKEMGDLVVGGRRIFSVGARNAHTYRDKEDE